MGGLRRSMPVTAVVFLVGVLSIVGVFPLAGFWSKDEILQATLASGRTGLSLVALITVFLTAFYMARLFFVVFMGRPRSDVHAHESPRIMTIPMVILALLAAGLGFTGSPWLARDIHAFLEPSATRAAGLDLSLLLQSNGLALAGILAAFLLYRQRQARARPAARGPSARPHGSGEQALGG